MSTIKIIIEKKNFVAFLVKKITNNLAELMSLKYIRIQFTVNCSYLKTLLPFFTGSQPVANYAIT